MPARKAVICFGILIGVLVANIIDTRNNPQAEAASSPTVAPNTPTLTPSTPRNNGRSNPGTASATSAPAGEFQTYVVQAGDNIYLVAQKVYGSNTKIAPILAANNLTENSRLLPGTTLKIPVLATPMATQTVASTPTVARVQPSATQVQATVPSQTGPRSDTNGSRDDWLGDDQVAIMTMLMTFATSTLAGATLVCGFLAVVVYSSTRRIARRQAMARRIRPPLVH